MWFCGDIMKLYEEILLNEFQSETLKSLILPKTIQLEQIVELACYSALEQIKAILEDDTLDDCNCFQKIEEIVRVYEQLGSDCGNRHDF